MGRIRHFSARLAALFRRGRLDDELAEEIGLHVELRGALVTAQVALSLLLVTAASPAWRRCSEPLRCSCRESVCTD